jgi:hypothetical protein
VLSIALRSCLACAPLVAVLLGGVGCSCSGLVDGSDGGGRGGDDGSLRDGARTDGPLADGAPAQGDASPTDALVALDGGEVDRCAIGGAFSLDLDRAGAAICPEAPTGTGVVRHVAPGGDDSGDGTSASAPLATLGRAIALAGPGDVISLADGVYREGIETTRGGAEGAPITIRAAPGATPVIAGSAAVSTWSPASGAPSNVYVTSWDPSLTPTGFRGPEAVTRGAPQTVFVDGAPLQQIGIQGDSPHASCPTPGGVCRAVVGATLADLADHPGSFFFDSASSQLYVRLADDGDPSSHLVEVPQHRRVLFFYPASPGFVCLEGLTFRHSNASAAHAQMAAVSVPEASTMSRSIVEWTDLTGVSLRSGATLTRSIARHNGQTGISSSGQGIRIERSEIHGNNWRHFNAFWEAGGIKITSGATGTVEELHVHDNDGPGIWLDFAVRDDPDGFTIARNWVHGNGREAQIFVEVSSPVRVVNNVVWNDGRIADSAVRGIYIAESSDAVVELNTVIASAPSFLFDASSGGRGTAEGLSMRGNVFADFGETAPDHARVRIPALTSWSSDHNLFYAAAVPFGLPRGEGTLADWQALSGVDAASIEGDPRFVDPAGRDVRPTPDSPVVDAVPSSTITVDFSGRSRPVGAAWDIGALEGCSR